MSRSLRSYTDVHAELFRLLGNRDRLAIYGCLHHQSNVSVTELCDLMGWESEDGSADLQAMRRHLKELCHYGVVSRVDADKVWLCEENMLKGRLGDAINALCR